MTDCNCTLWVNGCSQGYNVDEYGYPIELIDCLYYQPLTCAHCGHTGPEVEFVYGHIGGDIGIVAITECVNRIACWQRWERNQLAQIRR